MNLAACLQRAKSLSQDDVAAVKEIAQGYKDTGMEPGLAERQAVSDQIGTAYMDKADLLAEIASMGGKIPNDELKPRNRPTKALSHKDRTLLENDLVTAEALEANPFQAAILAGRKDAAKHLAALMGGETTMSGRLIDEIQLMLDPNDPYQVLLKKLRNTAANDVPTTVLDVGDMVDEAGSANGQYKSYTAEDGSPRRVIFLRDGVLDSAHGVKVLVHELVHAAVAEGMTTNNPVAVEMEEIRLETIDYLEAMGDQEALTAYGFENVDEFVSEALSSAAFQQILARVKTGGKSLWQRFVDAISRYLGMPVANDSALAEVLSLAPGLFMSSEQATDAMVQGKRKFISETMEGRAAAPTEAEIMEMMRGDRSRPHFERAKLVSAVRALSDKPTSRVAGKFYDTLVGSVDPKEKKRGLARGGLGFHTTDQIIRRFKSHFEAGTENAMAVYAAVRRKKSSLARDAQQIAEKLNQRWRDFEKKDGAAAIKLAKLMHNATMLKMHPDLAFYNDANKHVWDAPGAQQQHAGLQADFNSLPPAARALYRQVRQFYIDQRNDLRRATLTHMARVHNLDKAMSAVDYRRIINATTAEEIKAINFGMLGSAAQEVETSLAHVATLTSVAGPYFPLRRWGKYVVEAVKEGEFIGQQFDKRADAWSAAWDVRKDDPFSKIRTRKMPNGRYQHERTNRVVKMFDSISEAEAFATEIMAEGYSGARGGDVLPSLKRDWKLPPSSAANTLLGQAKRKFGADSPQAKALDMAFLEMLLENSTRKSELPRKNVAGASLDMRRAFAERAYAGSWAIADIHTALDHDNAMREMFKQATGNVPAEEAVAELKKRDEKALEERRISKAESAISKFGFLYYLFSPSYTAINLTQVPLVTAPYVNGKYGTAGMRELFRAYRGVSSAALSELNRVKFGFSGAPVSILDAVMNAEGVTAAERTMIDDLANLGIIDATFMQELYKASQGAESNRLVARAIDRTLDVARASPQVAEVINRVVTARAVFNAELKRGATAEQATAAAAEGVLETQFDYTDENKPRYFKIFTGARAIMMFKMYAQGIYALLASNTVNSFRGTNKAEARKTLAGLITTHTLAAGALGGIFIEPVRMLISAAAFFFADDDWDLENETTQFLADLTSPEVAEVLARGLPRAVGMDLHGRVGLNNLAFMSMRDTRSYEEWYKNAIIALGGPVVAAGSNILRGADYMMKNEVMRGISTAAPKLVRDPLKTVAMSEYGMLDYNGNTIAQPAHFSAPDYIQQFFGLQPAAAARVYESRTAQKNAETKLNDRRKVLMQMWRRADSAGKSQLWQEKILPFNQDNHEFAIMPQDLVKGLIEQKRREAMTRGGVFTEKMQIRNIGNAYPQ